MKVIDYAGGRFATSDAVAEIVVRYAAELASVGRADSLEVPAVRDGRPIRVDLLVGPASQLLPQPLATADPEPDSEEFVEAVRAKIDRVRSGFFGAGSSSAVDWDV